MRRLLSFACEGAGLAGSLDEAAGTTGLLMVTGGSQTRVGSHRMYERLANALAENAIPCFRYDRRGVGDSAGEDQGFRGSGPDMVAAAAAFRAGAGVDRVVGFGLCDGASALALFGRTAGLDALILVNPWLVEAEADAPPPAAIRAHYRQRLLSVEGWKKIASGRIDYRKLLKGVGKASLSQEASPLARDVAAGMRASGLRSWLILAEGDATAAAATNELKARAFAGLIEGREIVKTDSHTFARPGDEAALLAATIRAIKALAG